MEVNPVIMAAIPLVVLLLRYVSANFQGRAAYWTGLGLAVLIAALDYLGMPVGDVNAVTAIMSFLASVGVVQGVKAAGGEKVLRGRAE